jgi:ribosomal protein L9
VSPKAILEELQKTVNDDYLSQKRVKVTGVTQDGTKHRGDIKHVGEYGVTLSLTKEISAKFPVKVQGES